MNKMQYQLFERTYYDLRNKLNGDGYDYIKGLGLVRLLILDGAISLVTQCNRELKLKIIYKTRKIAVRENNTKILWSEISPLEFSYEEVENLSLDQFLAKSIFTYEDYQYTVKDFILYGSNVIGGVHSRNPSIEKEKIFVWAQSAFPFPNTYHSIIKIVVTALQPLHNEIILLKG